MLTETLISASPRTKFSQYVRDLWSYRDLFRALLERDIRVRYKQTIFGILWVIAPPLMLAGVFTIIFGRVLKMPTPEGMPPLLFFLSASIPWSCFANGLSQAANSLESNAGLIGKVYFPRMIIPAAVLCGTVVDFTISWAFFNVVAIYMGFWTWLFLPFTILLLVLQLSAALGAGLFLAALNAQFRDIRYVTPFLVQLGMWMTPVVWPAHRLLTTRFSDQLVAFLYINPMAGVIETYRALLSGDYVPYKLLFFNLLVTLGLLLLGISFFHKREQKIVDLL